jgi:hypothetical protein
MYILGEYSVAGHSPVDVLGEDDVPVLVVLVVVLVGVLYFLGVVGHAKTIMNYSGS